MLFIYFKERGREGETHGCVRDPVISCLSHTPNREPGRQTRPVPWLGIEPAIQFMGRHSVHWATPARALLGYRIRLCNLLSWFRNNLLLLRKEHLQCGGRAHPCVGWPARELCKLCSAATLFTWVCSMTTEATAKAWSSALLSAFLSTCSKNSALFVPLILCPAPLFGLSAPASSIAVTAEWLTLLL